MIVFSLALWVSFAPQRALRSLGLHGRFNLLLPLVVLVAPVGSEGSTGPVRPEQRAHRTRRGAAGPSTADDRGWCAMIVWFAATPTPQFCGVFNALSSGANLDLSFHYVTGQSAGRGWASLPIKHPHSFIPRGKRSSFLEGLRVGLSPRTTKVVTFGYTNPFVIALLLAARIRKLPVFTQSDSKVEDHLSRTTWRRALKWATLRLLYSRNTRVWAIGDANSAYWSAFGLNNQIRVPFESPVPEGTDLPERATELRQRLGIAPGVKVVLYVGRLVATKRVADIVAAVNRLNRDNTKVALVIVGVGDDPPQVGPGVVLVGAVTRSELAPYYAFADVLALASEREAYGLVVREALQFGLPVVATDAVASAKQLCDRGWNLVSVGDVDGLGDAIARALQERRWQPIPFRDLVPLYAGELNEPQ